MPSNEMSVCPVHPIVDVANSSPGGDEECPARQYALRLAISESLYQKLVAAHHRVRLPNGARVELRTLLELALDLLLIQKGEPNKSVEPNHSDAADAEPVTERVPFTMRWPSELA